MGGFTDICQRVFINFSGEILGVSLVFIVLVMLFASLPQSDMFCLTDLITQPIISQ